MGKEKITQDNIIHFNTVLTKEQVKRLIELSNNEALQSYPMSKYFIDRDGQVMKKRGVL